MNFLCKNLRIILISAVLTGIMAGISFAVVIPAGGAIRPDNLRLYLPDQQNNRLVIVDTSGVNPTKYISLTGAPMGMAVKPDATRLYVSVNKSSDSQILEFDIGTRDNPADPASAKNTITLSGLSSPMGMALTPNGDRLYVADSILGVVHIINTSNGNFSDTGTDISIAGTPNLYGVALKPDGSKLYVSERASPGRVFVYSLNGTPSYLKTINNLVYPTYLLTSDDGSKLYVKLRNVDSPLSTVDVNIYSATDEALINSVSLFSSYQYPVGANLFEGIALGPNGAYLYLTHYNSSDNSVWAYRCNSQGNSPTDMVYSFTYTDFLVSSPTGIPLWAAYSAPGSSVKLENNTGYDPAKPVPVSTYFISPKKGDTGVTSATWFNIPGVVKYELQYATTSEVAVGTWHGPSSWASISNTNTISLVQIIYDGGTPGGDYYLRIRPFSFSNVYGPWAYTGPFTLGAAGDFQPGIVSNFIVTPIPSTESVRFDWVNPSGDPNFKGVRIRYRTDGVFPQNPTDGTWLNDITGTAGSPDSYSTLFLNADATYYFAAFAYGQSGATIYYGSPVTSMEVVDFVSPASVTNLTAVGGTGQISLTWTNPTLNETGTALTDLSGVMIVRRKETDPPLSSIVNGTVYNVGDSIGGGIVIAKLLGTSYIDSDPTLISGVTYTYYVWAYDEVPNYSLTYDFASAAPIGDVEGGIAIDKFDGAETDLPPGGVIPGGDYYKFAGGAGISEASVINDANSYNGTNAARIKYSYTLLGWDGWGANLNNSDLNISDPTLLAVRFMLRGDGSLNTIILQLKESASCPGNSATKYEAYISPEISLKDRRWHEVIIPYSSFSRDLTNPDDPGASGNKQFDKRLRGYSIKYGTGADVSSSNYHYIDNIVAIGDTSLPGSFTLMATIEAATNVILSWNRPTDNGSIIGYNVYRASNSTGPWSKLNTLLVTPEGYTDLGIVLGMTPGSCYFYYVEALDNFYNKSNSNMASVYKSVAMNGTISTPGKYWISIPYNNSLTDAASLLNSFSTVANVSRVSRFNPVTQAWENYPGVNFSILTGEGFEILVTGPTDITIAGSYDPGFVFNLTNLGYHLISLPYNGAFTNAQDIVNSMNGGLVPGTCIRIQRVNPSTGLIESYYYSTSLGWTGTNFSFLPGEGYRINLTGNPNWTPPTY